jgi:hypothetical protein
MSAPFIVPPTMNPIQTVSVTSASNYTVPVGQYANVHIFHCAFESSQSPSVDINPNSLTEADLPRINTGVMICDHFDSVVNFSFSGGAPPVRSYNVNLGVTFSCREFRASLGTFVGTYDFIVSQQSSTGLATFRTQTVTASSTIFLSDTSARRILVSLQKNSGAADVVRTQIGFKIDRGYSANTFWLRAGDILTLPTGTRPNIIVSLYNDIT